MTFQTRPPPRRGPSGAWSRLRTTAVDPLEAYGLPSKGETRLSDLKVQETYFETIVTRYMRFCASCGTSERLEEAFARLSVNTSAVVPGIREGRVIGGAGGNGGGIGSGGSDGTGIENMGGREGSTSAGVSSGSISQTAAQSQSQPQQSWRRTPSTTTATISSSAPTTKPTSQQPFSSTTSTFLTTTNTTCTPNVNLNANSNPSNSTHTTTVPLPSTSELPTLLLALRKLREALTSTHRTDPFAQRVYIFSSRTTLHPFAHPESYHPSLLHLLQKVHPHCPLTPAELSEFASYLILDLACRQGELQEAYAVRKKYAVRDWKVDRVLEALVRDDWCAFWKVRRIVDGGYRVLMGWAEERMREHVLKVLGRAYLSADRAFVERAADREWSRLVAEDGVGWVLEGSGVVTIRKMKGR